MPHATVGILDGTIGAITEGPLDGRTVIYASGLIVAPGFIDLHYPRPGRSELSLPGDGRRHACDGDGGGSQVVVGPGVGGAGW